jgi:hypothetical protein
VKRVEAVGGHKGWREVARTKGDTGPLSRFSGLFGRTVRRTRLPVGSMSSDDEMINMVRRVSGHQGYWPGVRSLGGTSDYGASKCIKERMVRKRK